MAAKRISRSAIEWSKIAERVPEGQKLYFNALKTRSDNYLRRVLENPETAPKLDFAAYKSKVGIAGLVDNFQKQYEAVKIPYPTEDLTPKINEQEKQAMAEVKKFVAESNARIKEYEAKIARWDNVLPYEEMTLEDFKDAFPEQALDPLVRPTMWPHHIEDEQVGYVPPGGELPKPAH